MLTVDEQLDQALALIKHLESDARAGATLLSEASTKIDTLTAQVTELSAERERLSADLTTARQTIQSLGTQKGEIETRLAQLITRNAELEATEKDIEKRASKRAAEIVASTGTTAPAPVTAKADRQTEDLVARFKAITDPKAQTTFWRSLTPQQQALILSSAESTK